MPLCEPDRPAPAAWTLLHGGALGDLVLTIALTLQVRGAGSGARLHVLSRTDPGDLSACVPCITRQSTEGVGLHWLFGDDPGPPPAALSDSLAERRVLNAYGGPASQAHKRLKLLAGEHPVYSFDPAARPRGERHITEQWGAALAEQGVEFGQPERWLVAGEALRNAGRERLARAGCRGAPVLVMHPGSGGLHKCWPVAGFASVARVARDAGWSVAALLGPAEEERFPAASTESVRQVSHALLTSLDSHALAQVLAGADAYVGNDAGPTHLAALLGTPTVAVFGPTPATVWRPLGARVQVIVRAPGETTVDWGIHATQVFATVAALADRA